MRNCLLMAIGLLLLISGTVATRRLAFDGAVTPWGEYKDGFVLVITGLILVTGNWDRWKRLNRSK